MKLDEIVEILDGTVLTQAYDGTTEINIGFVGDLLSVVIGKAQADCVWVTIQGHINVVAVATLVDCACVVVAEGYEVESDALAKANLEEIPIISTKLSSFEAVALLSKNGVQ